MTAEKLSFLKKREGGKPKRLRLSIFDRFGLLCTIILSGYLTYLFSLNLYDILTIAFDRFTFIKYLFLLILSLSSFISVITIARKTIWLESLVDSSFEDGVYRKLEPLIGEFAKSEAEFNRLYDYLYKMDQKFNEIRKDYIEEKQKRTFQGMEGASAKPIQYLIKYVILINITLASFIFMTGFPAGYTTYVNPVIYFIWWLVLTAEFKLWGNNTALFWAIVPVVLLPVTTIILDSIIGSTMTFAIIYILLGIYAFSYYAWGLYKTRGMLPFDLHEQREALDKLMHRK